MSEHDGSVTEHDKGKGKGFGNFVERTIYAHNLGDGGIMMQSGRRIRLIQQDMLRTKAIGRW